MEVYGTTVAGVNPCPYVSGFPGAGPTTKKGTAGESAIGFLTESAPTAVAGNTTWSFSVNGNVQNGANSDVYTLNEGDPASNCQLLYSLRT